jgi:hypothetical protein
LDSCVGCPRQGCREFKKQLTARGKSGRILVLQVPFKTGPERPEKERKRDDRPNPYIHYEYVGFFMPIYRDITVLTYEVNLVG